MTDMLNRVAERVFATIEEHVRDAAVLAFWMANASELLHFLKSDRHITSFSHQVLHISIASSILKKKCTKVTLEW